MAEEQFTSRRARREAERLAAEQAFEARETPEQPSESPSNQRAELLSPPQPPADKPVVPSDKPDEASAETSEADAAKTAASAPSVEPSSNEAQHSPRIDPNPAPGVVHERGALATDHPQESRPPVNAEDRLDPQRAPLPHFESRAARKQYLRENGLSLEGDLSTGALPVVAEPGEDSKPSDESAGAPEFIEARSDRARTDNDSDPSEHESYDTAGFGGAADEVAARDFEAPVTPDSAPRPTTTDEEPLDALSQPIETLEQDQAESASGATAEADTEDSATAETDSASVPTAQSPVDSQAPHDEDAPDDALNAPLDSFQATAAPAEEDASADPTAASAATDESKDERASQTRSRRMPIVQPPSTSGVRVVTAASAQIPEPEEQASTSSGASEDAAGESAAAPRDSAEADSDQRTDSTGTAGGPESGRSRPADSSSAERDVEVSSDDAARALAANPETRPMDTVPEAWALPNSNYEDEETENPPGTRVRASAVTGHDGQILVGEEPSKVPFVVLGVAALFAVGLIVIALVMLL